MYGKKSHFFSYGNHTVGSVYWLSVFLTCPLLSNICGTVERILSTMVQKLTVILFIMTIVSFN